MSAIRQMTVTLPQDLVEKVREKQATEGYETEADVIRDGLLALDNDRARFERWLRDEVLPAAKALDEDPSRAISIEEVMEEFGEPGDR